MVDDHKKILALVNEDEEPIREVLGEMLESKLECTVESSEGGINSINLIGTTPFDVIVTDFRMPKMDGGQFVQVLRETKGPNQNIPVIFLSGYLEEAIESTKDLPNIFYLDKPIIGDDLLELVNKVLGH